MSTCEGFTMIRKFAVATMVFAVLSEGKERDMKTSTNYIIMTITSTVRRKTFWQNVTICSPVKILVIIYSNKIQSVLKLYGLLWTIYWMMMKSLICIDRPVHQKWLKKKNGWSVKHQGLLIFQKTKSCWVIGWFGSSKICDFLYWIMISIWQLIIIQGCFS